jgi:hypothetical protein
MHTPGGNVWLYYIVRPLPQKDVDIDTMSFLLEKPVFAGFSAF